MSDIRYQLIRSSRKTICISIRNKAVIVRAPLRTPLSKIEEFIKQKSSWISKQLLKESVYTDLNSYEHVLIKGNTVPLKLGYENLISNDCVCVKKLSDLKNLYIKSFGEEFLMLFNEICNASGLKASSVSFRSYRARWGCCDSKKQIIFNYKLLMLPVDLWRCVIVHELCHTVFMNHSENFHALAESIMPDYRVVHKGLEKYVAITRLY